jgi:hypothetical protein
MGCAPDQLSRSPLDWAGIAKPGRLPPGRLGSPRSGSLGPPGRLPPGRPGLSPSSGWAGSSDPARPPLHRAPAGPDQEDPACPGIFSRPPPCSPGWAGLGYSGWARLVLPWPRPDYLHNRPNYSSPGPRLTPSGIFTSSSFTPASCASPGMPPGSD